MSVTASHAGRAKVAVATRVAAVATLCLGAGLATGVLPALADPPGLSINTGGGWVQGSTTPLFSVGTIVPGWSDTQSFEIRSDMPTDGALYISSNDIIEAENGCNAAESLVDATCGPNDGELGHDLQFSVFVDPEDDGTFEATPRWSGTLYDIATPIVLSPSMPAGSIWGVRITAALPLATGNEAQSDQVGFDFALTLTGASVPNTPGTPGEPGTPGSGGSGSSTGPGPVTTPQGPGSVEVKGIKVTRHHHSSVLHDITSQLPFTGSETERMVAGALWLLVAGTALSFLAAIRRRRPAGD